MSKKIKTGDHRGMILHPGEWPRWPVLPLKRRNPETVLGDMAFLCANTRCMTAVVGRERADADKPFTIFLGMMFQDPNKLDTKTYPNVDALLADGWEVD